MTETSGTEDSARSPSKGKSPSKEDAQPMEVDLTVETEPEVNQNAEAANSPATPSTPKSSTKLDASCFKTPETPATPTGTGNSKKRKRLTPEEKNLKERERLEKRRKLEEEKQKKEQERLEKARQREEEKRQREEEKQRKDEEKRRQEEERRLERLKKEEEKKKLEEEKKQERLKKEEERKKLEEEKQKERLKKEEERKKKEEERRLQLEEKEKEQKKLEEKKAKQAKFFTNFFKKAESPKVQVIEDGNVYLAPKATLTSASAATGESSGEKNGDSTATTPDGSKNSSLFNPLPFQIKTDMAVAPLCRRDKLSTDAKSKLDSVIDLEAAEPLTPEESNYLKSVKIGKGRKSGKTEVKYAKDSEIQVIDDNIEKPRCLSGYLKWRMKMLQFHENRRPAYWGTWKMKPKRVTSRRPFVREEDVDYDFDSDDEWDEEPEDAEEIVDSDKEEKEDQEDADEEDEEGWMVPHGYLSDSEREGTHEDLESMKSKEKEFYKSLSAKSMMGYPFIETTNLTIYAIRVCPVFKSAEPVKPIRKRKPKVKPEVAAANSNATEEALIATSTDDKTTPALLPTPGPDSAKTATPTSEKKSKRVRKVPDNSNPYARPSSGFLAQEYPSDDEEDVDWEEEDDSENSSSDSEGTDGDIENDSDDDESSSDEDLFTPIKSSPKHKDEK